MGNNLDLKTATVQFGKASVDLAYATLQYPFSGSWKRLVVAGPAVLLIASGTGAIVYSVVTRIFRTVLSGIYNAASSVSRDFFGSRQVQQQKRSSSPHSKVQEKKEEKPVSTSGVEKAANVSPLVIMRPLPLNAAKDRNEALLKFAGIVEDFIINPLMQKEKFVKTVPSSEASLKSWLKSMTLWRLGILWDELECQYVQFKNPPVETVDSILVQVEKINADFKLVFSSGTNIAETILNSDLPFNDKLALAGLSFKLKGIKENKPLDDKTKNDEEQKLREEFALSMHQGMANTLSHMTGIIHGWMAVINRNAVAIKAEEPAAAPKREEDDEITKLVKEVSGQVKTDLTNNYLDPLWKKKYEEWNLAVREELKNQKGDLGLFDQYMQGQFDEKTFLDQQCHLTTSLTSTIFFMKAVFIMGDNPDSFTQGTQKILESIFAQVTPTVADALKKTADAITQISFERTVPKFANYLIELIEYCTKMQQLPAGALDESFYFVKEDSPPFIEALKRSSYDKFDWNIVGKMYKDLSSDVSRKKIIQKFPEIHPVLRSMNPAQAELGWIRGSKEKLKTVLRIHAEKYASQEGGWLATLLKANDESNSPSIVGQLLAVSTKFRNIPAFDGIMTFIFSGVEAVIASKGEQSAQKALHELTSTGKLSTLIKISLVKSFIAKEDDKWDENLPTLQLAFQFLNQDEKNIVLKHLGVVVDGDKLGERSAALITYVAENKDKIDAMLEIEKNLATALDHLNKALETVEDANDRASITEAFNKIKREKELQQFDCAQQLVIAVMGQKLNHLPTFISEIVLKLIHEAMSLLTYQELVKHWIYSMTDLLIEELNESTQEKEDSDDNIAEDRVCLLDLLNDEQKNQVLKSLTAFMNAAEPARGWLNAKAWVKSVANVVVDWRPDTIWSQLEQYKETLTLSPVELKDLIFGKLGTWGKDPNGLSDTLVQALTEHVADPRLQEKK